MALHARQFERVSMALKQAETNKGVDFAQIMNRILLIHYFQVVVHDDTYTPVIRKLARPAGLEPATPSLEGSCSIRLNYGRAREGE